MSLERFQEKSTDNILTGIEASKQVPFERVLYAMGIRYVGETVAKKLARHYKSLDALINASKEQWVEVDEIGERIAESVVNFFADEANLNLIDQLKAEGLHLEIEATGVETTELLAGKKIVVSGVFERYERNELKELIEQNGGKNVGSVSSKTDYILAGEGMGPSKLAKAEKLGIPIIGEEEFLNMIGKA